jgi:FKBP-type peptidyl-prolyl cis-trans isomerase 2
MPRIISGATVTIHYSLTIDGTVWDSTEGTLPVTYVQGRGQLIPGLEEKLEGYREGEKTRVVVPPEKAYGTYQPENIHEIERSVFTNPDEVTVGMTVEGRSRLGAPFRAKVLEVKDDGFVVDLNHPFAGKYLEFEVEVVSIVPPDVERESPEPG